MRLLRRQSDGTRSRGMTSGGLTGIVLALLGLLSASAGDIQGIDEYEMKAAYLNKFLKYVTWPAERIADKSAPLVVGVLDPDPFGAKLDAVFKDRKVDEHPIVIRRLPTLEGIAEVHVLFVPEPASQRLKEIVAATVAASVLLVGESTDFALEGGVINFYIDGNKLRFEINTDSARRQKLKVSSDLLKLARIVTDRK